MKAAFCFPLADPTNRAVTVAQRAVKSTGNIR
ncbi:hypothetical protein M2372_000518 [Chryseobacterium sp. BIGb0232]|nr:hypothetical protein [Chryseobacterium sp. BIGb0232]ROS20051.1 hypothetical protein EDF65_0752 [Chryseobacterium nakagawai]